jgi:hypothetical protein
MKQLLAIGALIVLSLSPAFANPILVDSGKPPSEPALPSVVDLSPYYTSVFHDPEGADSTFKGYVGRKTVDGLPFEIGGKIVLSGQENIEHGGHQPEDVPGIEIGRKFDELHLLHAAEWEEYFGCPIATVRLHYADGSTHDFPIRFNYQVNDWNRLYTEEKEIIGDPATKIIWRGPGIYEGEARLFKSVLVNPHPSRLVDSMELISKGMDASYVLVAATVAKRDRTRDVTPPMKLRPSRHFDGALRVRVVDRKSGEPLDKAEIYPVIGIKNFNLVADNVLTSANGKATVKYPLSTATSVWIKVARDGYKPFNADYHLIWDIDEVVPDAVTIRLRPEGDATPAEGN